MSALTCFYRILVLVLVFLCLFLRVVLSTYLISHHSLASVTNRPSKTHRNHGRFPPFHHQPARTVLSAQDDVLICRIRCASTIHPLYLSLFQPLNSIPTCFLRYTNTECFRRPARYIPLPTLIAPLLQCDRRYKHLIFKT